MTLVHILLTRADEPVPDGSHQVWETYPKGFATSMDIVLTNGEATEDIEPTNVYFCWVVKTFIFDERGSSKKYKLVPDQIEPLEYDDLDDVDFGTIISPGGPPPLWFSELEGYAKLVEQYTLDYPRYIVLAEGETTPPDGTPPNTLVFIKN